MKAEGRRWGFEKWHDFVSPFPHESSNFLFWRQRDRPLIILPQWWPFMTP
jgi:hypothetical protein